MKHMKKILALVLAMVMVLAMSVTVFADEPDISDTNGTFSYEKLTKDTTSSSLTVTNIGKTTHTFQLYQILVGDVAPVSPATNPATATLSNISWGDGVTSTGQSALGDATDFAKTLTDAAKAKVFADNFMQNASYKGTAIEKEAAAGANAEWTGLNPGYYLVIDKAETQGTNAQPVENGAYTAYIMQVVGTVTRNAKLDVPAVEKKVKENTKTVNADGNATDTKIPEYAIPAYYNDVADYNVGDTVPFQIIGTLPENYAEYETYYYEFVDTTCDGLAIDEDSATVHINTSTGTDITNMFTITLSGNSFNVKCDNLKTNTSITKDTKIVLDYNAVLDKDAEIGLPGNPNEVYLKFSNNPNKGGEGDKGETPEDKVIVFTYELDTNKKDGEGNNLANASFVIKNANGKYLVVNETTKAISWIAYTPTGTINTDAYVNAFKAAGVTVFTSGADGVITKIQGLDDEEGSYTITEIKAPDGYNMVGDKSVTIDATTVNGQTWTEVPAEALTKFEYTFDTTPVTQDGTNVAIDGIAKGDIVNEKGIVLPSTGGVGTTMFYVIGAVLVIGAGVVLITRRRMAAK